MEYCIFCGHQVDRDGWYEHMKYVHRAVVTEQPFEPIPYKERIPHTDRDKESGVPSQECREATPQEHFKEYCDAMERSDKD